MLLALDTSSAVTSIALAQGDAILRSRTLRHEDRRSEQLWTDVTSLLEDVALSVEDLDAFAVCVGPGGFTGLRVGIAAIKGLAMATGKPAAGVTSLEAAAFGARPGAPVCSLVNAYRDEVYSQLFDFDERGVPVARNEPLVSTSAAAFDRVAEMNELVFAGNAAAACEESIREGQASGMRWSISEGMSTVAENIALLSRLKGPATSASLKACYVRPAEAEVKLALGLLGSKIRRTLARQD